MLKRLLKAEVSRYDFIIEYLFCPYHLTISVKFCKMKRTISLSEVYSEPSRRSTMEFVVR